MRTIKLVCIPYAGASASIYMKWKKNLLKDIELVALELAGRGRRCDEPLYNNLQEAVDDLYREIANVMDRRDEYILFGHSMGSLLAFELYYKLLQEGFREPLHLYVSGGKAPHLERCAIYYDKPLEQFREHILNFDQKSELIFDNEELRSFFLPILRSDYKMVETYQYTNKKRKVSCDMTVLTGSKDFSLTLEDVNEWIIHAGKAFQIKQYEGGHLFITEYKDQIIEVIHEMVRKIEV